MYLRLGFVPTIVVSSPQAAELFLKTHDLTFASRPFTEAAKYISYERKGLSFAAYGAYWRNIRRLCTLQLLSSNKIDSYKSLRKEEALIETLEKASTSRVTVNVSNMVTSLSTYMSCRMVFGKKFKDGELDKLGKKGFQAVVQDGMKLAGLPNLADYIPYVGIFDVQGLAKRMKRDRSIDKDFVDVMLSYMESNNSEFPIDRSNIKAVILDMLVGSMDTSATAIKWVLAELLKHPRAMKSSKKKSRQQLGWTDGLHHKRLPHQQKVTNHSNTYAIGRDPSVWKDAEEFIPERFIGTNTDMRGNDFKFLPFGSGRRGCPGMQLGLVTIRLVVAQLVHCFDWELADGMSPRIWTWMRILGSLCLGQTI
ncbi:hypothetical protein GIB67_010110 [Kingdonia uniflora]|uniref:Cytochrome P450 n=1 Tax=Kingdonia uniflora TaxID=39325 RepID=A0A7J7MN50_9MAGN|nr:hypothetical protein GIB67_010110 [Kingdonia uniflora]